MNVELPVTEEWVISNLCGNRVRFYKALKAKTEYINNGDAIFEASGVLTDGVNATGRWRVENGALCLSGGRWIDVFDGFDTRNGVARLTGRNNVAAIVGKNSVDFGVLVSTCEKYRSDTLPVLLCALDKAGVGKDHIRVVSSGGNVEADGSVVDVDGVLVKIVKGNWMGGAGLLAGDLGSYPYWLMLHDTCSVDADLVARMQSVDLALNPDYVEFYDEIGVISCGLALTIAENMPMVRRDDLIVSIKAFARVTVLGSDNIVHTGKTKDVYATGTKRAVMANRAGVIKYAAQSMSKNRP